MDARPDRRADGVAYHRIDGFPKDMFRCEPWRANLAVDACERRWREAQVARGEEAQRLERCRACQIGAAHAGEEVRHRSPLFGAPVCPRCRRGTTRRLIGNRLCISCYNREREVMVGKNGKGKPPQKLKLAKLRLGVVLDGDTPGRRVVAYEDLAVGFEEMMTQVLRTTEGRVAFVAAPDDAPAWEPPQPKRPLGATKCSKSAYL